MAQLTAGTGTDTGIRRGRSFKGQRGQALIETAIAIPIILLVAVSIFEFGRAYQTLQVMSNAAREGARVAVLPGATTADVQTRVKNYLQGGAIANFNAATVTLVPNTTIVVGAGTASASLVTVQLPFSFMVLNPIANLIVKGTPLGTPIVLTTTARMRNEAQS